jgi:DNA-binding Lrp family transcriptional regulator
MDELTKKLLMELQYKFPLSPRPFSVVGERLGISEDEIIEHLKHLKEQGILKRIGFYVNYKAYRQVAALVAFRTDDPDELNKLILREFITTHSYIRNHPYYNLWVVVRDKSRELIKEKIARIAEQGKADFVILWSKKVYRLSVKYDLYRGTSWAGPYSVIKENPPTPSKLGLSTELVSGFRSLPIMKRPYKNLAEKHGISEEELVKIAAMLLEKGVLGDPGVALDGHKAGFTYNAMVVMEPRVNEHETCKWIIDNIPEATHVVLREPWPPDKWRHVCYMMIHAKDSSLLKPVYEKIEESPVTKDYLPIISLRDLLPGVIR